MNHVIVINGLTKKYGSHVAVDDISFSVKKGEIFGFIGPNGAGKTSTIRMALGLIPPSSGSVTVLGHDMNRRPDLVRSKIGYVQQQPSVEFFMTVKENLDIYGSLWGIDKDKRQRRLEFLAEKFGLKDKLTQKALELSIGERRRLQVAREFMHEMDLLFLDEPTVGLDPILKRTLLDFIREKVRDDEIAVFFTTHVMSEAEYLCDRIVIIDKGKILACGMVNELKEKFRLTSILEILVERKDGRLVRVLESVEGVGKIVLSEDDKPIRISVGDPHSQTPKILNAIVQAGYVVSELRLKEPSLEDLFIETIKRGSQ